MSTTVQRVACFLGFGPTLRRRSVLMATLSTCRLCGLPLARGARGQSTRARVVLGIETTCDDTGVGVVDTDAVVRGEALHSQAQLSARMGGVIPWLARDVHAEKLPAIIGTALDRAKLSPSDIDAIACAITPGLSSSLKVGLAFAKHLAIKYRKPLIPIHHMEAHALTIRLTHRVTFPFMVLLMSGGHCILAICQDVKKFLVLGRHEAMAPGEMLDKFHRRLNLNSHPACQGLSGGAAIEKLAKLGDPLKYQTFIKPTSVDCNFAFSGLLTHFERKVEASELEHGVSSHEVVPDGADLCSAMQHNLLFQLCNRLQRAMLFVRSKSMLPENQENTLVISGGVARNQFLLSGLKELASYYGYRILCPTPELCSDNGVMIAWNGVEKLKADLDVNVEPGSIHIVPTKRFVKLHVLLSVDYEAVDVS